MLVLIGCCQTPQADYGEHDDYMLVVIIFSAVFLLLFGMVIYCVGRDKQRKSKPWSFDAELERLRLEGIRAGEGGAFRQLTLDGEVMLQVCVAVRLWCCSLVKPADLSTSVVNYCGGMLTGRI